jgi:hypothetical protein
MYIKQFQMLGYFGDKTVTEVVVPLVIQICDRAKKEEDETLPKIAHHLGRVCHGLANFLKPDQKEWLLLFYAHLAKVGLGSATTASPTTSPAAKTTLTPTSAPTLTTTLTTSLNDSQPMPDLLPSADTEKSDYLAECRQQVTALSECQTS